MKFKELWKVFKSIKLKWDEFDENKLLSKDGLKKKKEKERKKRN